MNFRFLILLSLSLPGMGAFAQDTPEKNFTSKEESTQEEESGFKPDFSFLIREEPNYSVNRGDSLINPSDLLGFPRFQNRLLFSADAKIPVISGKGLNPVTEFVFGTTLVYIQNEGEETTIAKQQIADVRNFAKEFYLNIRPSNSILLNLGRKNISEGTGYSRNPTDFLANPSTLPGSNFDNRVRIRNREGSILAKGEFNWDGGALSYTYVPKIDQTNVSDPKTATEIDRLTVFNRTEAHWIKLYQFWGGFDFNLHYFYRERHNVGFAFSKVLGDALELHGEVRVSKGSDFRKAYRKSEDVFMGPVLVQPALYDFQGVNQDAIYSRTLAGGQYTFTNKLNLSVEYYYNGEGYTKDQIEHLYNGLELANSRYNNSSFNFSQGNPYRLFILSANLNYSFLQMGRHYSFIRLWDPELFGSNKWEASAYMNMSLTDVSGFAAGELAYKWNDYADIQLLVNHFFGSRKSEAGLFYSGWVILAAVEAQF